MHTTRRQLLVALATASLAPAAMASDFPSRPIKILVGFAPGGSTDVVARFYAQKMSEILKAPVIVDNKPGAGQMVAIRALQAAQADGYTLYLGTASALSQLPAIRSDLSYNTLKDFSMVGLMATAPGVVLVSPKLKVGSLRELARLPEASAGTLNYASSGVGSASHLQTEYLKQVTGIKMAHIPFKADADIMREMYAGTVQFGLTPAQGAMASISSGKVKALAVTGSHRLKSLPDVPSLKELDFKGIEGIDPYSYYGLVGPIGLPSDVVAKLNSAINKVSSDPAVIKQLREHLNFEPEVGSPDRLRKFIQADIDKWAAFGKLVKLTE
ncbi:tripartite tricarboxylate transporter substrate binding protein [Variovorax defluvii]|uniref:Tripartite tricarboxylate transporter substrate binding protein n=1 Tax=Variovorax defluvii TaxID=913761 RepID=A0ABP8HY39_9BURK